ncbi:hypothetical protein ANCCAN_00631 [Ancylostoma caninum]|uniref:Uncharacterized protein n=1 Tax=Ancylostoma caninum TaxID=29170 RepID=A0A368H908_ANCCA|nr:hypothetical protein ANCCAN_00631 [Ancylostoma caninum]
MLRLFSVTSIDRNRAVLQSGSVKYYVNTTDDTKYAVDLYAYFGDYIAGEVKKRGIQVRAIPELEVTIIEAEAVGDAAAVIWKLEGNTSSDVPHFVVDHWRKEKMDYFEKNLRLQLRHKLVIMSVSSILEM